MLLASRSLRSRLSARPFCLSPAQKELLHNPDTSLLRNLGIIAHVDHGKTTLVDCLLNTEGVDLNERAMDNIDIEQERGITIMSKVTSILHNNHKLNIVDTPGHADFGGEVERIMDMVDGVCLVVCATEGPMAQTKFVLEKALKKGCLPIVVINKVDRPSARLDEVEDEVFDLFCNLEPTDEQLEYPTLYASAKEGWAVDDMEKPKEGVDDLLNAIIDRVPKPSILEGDDTPKMLISQTESNQYLGRMLVGKVNRGSIIKNDLLQAIDIDGKKVDSGKILKIMKKFGTGEIELDAAHAGDIVSVSGLGAATVSNTITSVTDFEPLMSIPIDPPMLNMTLTYNDSPFSGDDGDKCTINQIVERLVREAEDDVSLRVHVDPKASDKIKVSGRGDLHLGILLEKMRREGFELSVSPPEVTMKEDEDGNILEPIEIMTMEVEQNLSGPIIDQMNNRKGLLIEASDLPSGNTQLKFDVPSRGLLGFRGFLTALSRGQAVVSSEFDRFDDHRGEVKKVLKGAIISTTKGNCKAYTLRDVEQKGQLFVAPNFPVYEGLVIGEHILDTDMEMNPTKAKALTNVRTQGKEEQIKLQGHRSFTVEEAVAYMRDDELVELTPKWIRIRKQILSMNERRRVKRNSKSSKQKN